MFRSANCFFLHNPLIRSTGAPLNIWNIKAFKLYVKFASSFGAINWNRMLKYFFFVRFFYSWNLIWLPDRTAFFFRIVNIDLFNFICNGRFEFKFVYPSQCFTSHINGLLTKWMKFDVCLKSLNLFQSRSFYC